MNKNKILLSISLCVLSSLALAGTQLEPFNQFIHQLGNTKLTSIQSSVDYTQKDQEQFNQFKQQVLALYAGVQVKRSFFYHDQTIDCMSFLTQPGLKKVTSQAIAFAEYFFKQTKAHQPHVPLCHGDNIPMVRVNPMNLAKRGIFAFPKKQEWDARTYKYVKLPKEEFSFSNPDQQSALLKIDAADPFVSSRTHSHGQIWLMTEVKKGDKSPAGTLEGGWQKSGFFGVGAPILFVFSTQNAYESTSYNVRLPYVQLSQSFAPGMVLNFHGETKLPIQVAFNKIKHEVDGAEVSAYGFYFAYGETATPNLLGYYPKSAFTKEDDGPFVSVNAGGEVSYSEAGLYADMGTGICPNADNYQQATGYALEFCNQDFSSCENPYPVDTKQLIGFPFCGYHNGKSKFWYFGGRAEPHYGLLNCTQHDYSYRFVLPDGRPMIQNPLEYRRVYSMSFPKDEVYEKEDIALKICLNGFLGSCVSSGEANKKELTYDDTVSVLGDVGRDYSLVVICNHIMPDFRPFYIRRVSESQILNHEATEEYCDKLCGTQQQK